MRVFKYSLIVIIFSLIINVPRFFETQIIEETLISNNSGQAEVISFITYDVTQLRRDPDYIRYAIRILLLNIFSIIASPPLWNESRKKVPTIQKFTWNNNFFPLNLFPMASSHISLSSPTLVKYTSMCIITSLEY